MGVITQEIAIATNNFSKNLYFKEDIECLIYKLKKCIKNKTTDTEQTVRSKIIRMFKSYGIQLERTLTPEQYYKQLELNTILSIKDFPKMCWTEMMKVDVIYRTPKEYMERLVNELTSPVFNLPDTPVRVKILKQILSNLDCLRGTRFESKKLIDIIEKEYNGQINNIDDGIFENYLTPIQPCKYLKVLLDVYGNYLYSDDEKDDDLMSLVLRYEDSVGEKNANQLLQFIRANNPEIKVNSNGRKINSYNIVEYDSILVVQIKEYLDGVRISFKNNYDEDLKKIELLGHQVSIQQFPIILQFISDQNIFDLIKTKRFINLVKSHTGIEIGEDDINYSLFEKIMAYSLSPESKEKFNNYLIKQIDKFFAKADDKSKSEYDLFNAMLNRLENDCNRAQFEMITCFIQKNNLYELLSTSEIKNLSVFQEQNNKEAGISNYELMSRLTSVTNEHPDILKKVNPLLIKSIKDFRTETNQRFVKGLDNVSDRASIPEILKISNDLAEGKYKRCSEMKEILYIFAFAFEMSINFDDDNENNLRDVKKNLFEDFYCDNIIRYVNDYQKTGVYEEPTGITIQFKNFVEIVYLYWLNKDSKIYSPEKKYFSAREMIQEIVSIVKSAETIAENSPTRIGEEYFEAKKIADKKSLGTEVYRNYIRTDRENKGNKYLLIDNFLNLSEEEFMRTVLENYDVDTTLNYSTSAAFENENNQESAEYNFKKLIDKLKKQTEGFKFVTNCYTLEFYKTVFEELLAEKKHNIDLHLMLSTLVNKINEQINQVLNEAEIEGYNIYTRTRFMYLYYNNFILSRIEEKYIETFDDFYYEYCEELNKNLEDCSYQLFSEKNLIDIMLLYSAFIILRTEL